MRLGLIIVLLAGIAVAMVHIRRAEHTCRHDILRIRSVSVRRELWDQQSRMSRLTSPAEVRRRAERLALDLAEPGSERTVRLVHNER